MCISVHRCQLTARQMSPLLSPHAITAADGQSGCHSRAPHNVSDGRKANYKPVCNWQRDQRTLLFLLPFFNIRCDKTCFLSLDMHQNGSHIWSFPLETEIFYGRSSLRDVLRLESLFDYPLTMEDHSISHLVEYWRSHASESLASEAAHQEHVYTHTCRSCKHH